MNSYQTIVTLVLQRNVISVTCRSSSRKLQGIKGFALEGDYCAQFQLEVALPTKCVWRDYRLPVAAHVVELINFDFSSQRVAMDSQDLCGARLIAIGALKRPFDELLLEFEHSLFEENAAFHHHAHKGFELIFHDDTLREIDSFPEEKHASRATGMLAVKAERWFNRVYGL